MISVLWASYFLREEGSFQFPSCPCAAALLCNKRRQLVVSFLKSKVTRKRNITLKARWPPHINTQVAMRATSTSWSVSWICPRKGVVWGRASSLGPTEPSSEEGCLPQIARTVNCNWLKRDLILKNLVCCAYYVGVSECDYMCEYMCMNDITTCVGVRGQRQLSVLLPSTLLRTGLRDAFSEDG